MQLSTLRRRLPPLSNNYHRLLKSQISLIRPTWRWLILDFVKNSNHWEGINWIQRSPIHAKDEHNNVQSIDVRINETKALGESPGYREGCSIKLVDNMLYVVGGRSQAKTHFLEYLDLKKKEWFKFEIEGYRRRSFHSCLYLNGSFYLVGGYR